MTIKPFAIQGADLTLGGVNLQAGATTVVIPGVTQATNYRVEEVNDIDDVDQTQQFTNTIVVVDAITYAILAAGGNTTTTADFTAQLDDDNYIDEIEVNGQGTYTQQQATTNASTNMYAYRGTSSASDRPIVPNDWVQIPFRPKMRAGEVETISGGTGSGLVERTVNFPAGESGDTAGTQALAPWGSIYVCTADYVNVSDYGGSYEVETSDSYEIGQTGGTYNAVTILAADYPEIAYIFNNTSDGAQASNWIVNAGSAYGGSKTCTMLGNANQDTLTFYWPHRTGVDPDSMEEGFSADVNWDGPNIQQPAIWKQTDLGNLSISDGYITRSRYQGGESSLDLESDDVQLQVDNDDNSIAAIRLNNTDTDSTYVAVIVSAATEDTPPDYGSIWRFKHDGSLEFPDGTLQTTAYTGQGGGGVTVTTDLWIAGGESPGGAAVVTSTDGITWTPQLVTIPNSYISRIAISDTMIVYLASRPGTGDSIWYADAPDTTPTMATGTNAYQGGTLNWREINYIGGKFVAVGGAISTQTITSGITSVTLPAGDRTTLITLDNTSFDFSYFTVIIANATNTELNGTFKLVYNELDTVKTGVYELRNTDDSPVILTSTDVSGATLQSEQPQEVCYPVHAYSTDGITWTYGDVDPEYYMELGSYPYTYFSDVAYNGTGYFLPVVDDRFNSFNSDPTDDGPGAFYATDITAQLSVGQFIVGNGENITLPGRFNNIAGYADGTFFVCDDSFALWSSSDPLNTWTLHPLAPAITTLFGYSTGNEPGQVDGDVDSAVGGTVNGQAMWAGTTNEGQVIWTTDNGTTIQGSVPDPYVVTATLVTSSSTETLLDFAGEQEKPYQWEKVTLTVAQGDDTRWNGTYYLYAPDINSNSEFYLYDAVEGNGIPSDGFTAPVNPFNVTLSHGRDLDAIHIADDVCIVHSTSSNKLYRSTDMATWSTVFTNADYSVNDIYYGTRSSTASNRLDYTDEETSYNSSAVLTYDFKVDVDNAHLDVNGDGTWNIGSYDNDVHIGTNDVVDDGEVDIVVRTPNAEWTFDRNGKLHFPNGTAQTTAYVHQNINMDGGGAAVHYEQEVGFVDGGFSSTRHGVADPTFDGGNRLTVNNQYNLNGGGA